MNRQNTVVAGIGAIALIIVLGVLFGIMPQREAAQAAKDSETELAQTNSLLNIQLAALRKQKADMSELNAQLSLLRQQIPATANLATVTRVIVRALEPTSGSKGATLVAITPQVPPIAFTQREQLSADISTPEAVQPAPSGGASGTPLPAGTFQVVPLAIQATAPDVMSAFRFVDLLNSGPRMLGVHNVTITSAETGGGSSDGNTDPVTISVIGAAYLQPSADEAEEPAAPAAG